MKKRKSVFIIFSMLFTISLFIGVSLFIRFADVAPGNVRISPKLIRQKIVGKSSGNLRMLKTDGDTVNSNEIIGYISNGLKLEEVYKIDYLFNNVDSALSMEDFILVDFASYDLGFLEPYLSAFNETQRNLFDFQASKVSYRKTKSYESIISRNKDEFNILNRQVLSVNKEIIEQNTLLKKYKALLLTQTIDEQKVLVIEKQIRQLYNELNSLELRTVQLRNGTEKLRDEILIMSSEQVDRESRLSNSYIINFNRLKNKFNEWKENNLLESKVKGTVQYLKDWKEYDFIRLGDELMSIYPASDNIIADGFIDKKYVSRLEIGQTAYIVIDGYSYLENGKILGVLEKFSPIQNEEGLVHITIAIDYPILTTTNKSVKYFPDASGSLQIILEEKSVLSHLIDNFFDKFVN